MARKPVRRVRARPAPKSAKHGIVGDLQRIAVPVASLETDEENALPPSERSVKAMAEKLEAFGQHRPCVVQAQGGVVRCGNKMLLAARELGWTHVAALVVDEGDTEAMARAIADNRQAEQHDGWDTGRLVDQLRRMELETEGLATAVGFDSDEIAALERELEREASSQEGGGLRETRVPPAPSKPKTKPGDVWRLGDHLLACGDGLDDGLVDALLHESSAPAMVFTDPPYGISYDGKADNPRGGKKWRDGSGAIAGDASSMSDWRKFSASVARLLARSTEGCIYVCHAPGPDGRVMASALDAALHCSTTIIWRKQRFSLGRGKYHGQHEPIWFGWSKSGRRFVRDRDLSNVWDFDKPQASEDHPTMKPVALVARAVSHASRAGDVVFDPFAGSGSTLLACAQLERRCASVELSPAYCDVIVSRWEELTGGKASRSSGR